MRIIGCDLHARQQTLAMLDTTTRELVVLTLKHEGDQVRELYSSLPRPVRVGIEATGSMPWFVNLMAELGIECRVGHPATIRAILDWAPTAPVRLNPDIPTKLEEVINKALEKNRDLRYQHASEMRADLQRLKRDYESGKAGGGESSETSALVAPLLVPRDEPASAGALVSEIARRHRKMLFLAAFGICALLAILGYGLYRFGVRHAHRNAPALIP
jgi:hypothetical protein